MKMPDYVKNCIEILERSGFSAYAVGGAVRDCLLGLEPSDWDVTTSATPDETLKVFADYRTIPTGIKHGTITVLFDENGKQVPIEITTFRIDGEYRDNRHPESVLFSRDVRDDLSRRDFTVNAMAYNEREGLVDAFGSKKDLENRIIRAVGDPEKRFTEDALRILRAFRFSAQLGFEIEEKTLSAAQKCAPLLQSIARERVGAEFKKLIASRGVAYTLKKMIENGVWSATFGASLPSNDLILKLSNLECGDFATRLVILISEFTDEGKAKFLNSLRLSNKEKSLVLRLSLVKNFVFDENFAKNDACARRFLHLYTNISTQGIVLLRFWGERDFADLVSSEANKKPPLSISELDIRGGDILAICGDDHTRVGVILNELLERVIEDPTLNENSKLIEIAKKSLV